VSLVARYLERNGIPTVVMGAAKDIVEWTGVPRFLFSDFPARQFLRQAARAGHAALHARSGAQGAGERRRSAHDRSSPLRWNDDGDWKQDYNNLARMPAE
jgi:hypothetical protein